MTPCPKCLALGWVIDYDRMHSPIEICPECEGEKYLNISKDRSILGVCEKCKQAVSILGDPPCLPSSSHVITSEVS